MVAVGGSAKIDHIERRRLETQRRLDSTKTQAERNKLGQFATPTVLASDILGYAKTLAPVSQQIFFLDPAFGTGAFYSALLKSFPSLQIARAFGAALNDLGAEAPLEHIESLARQKLSHCAATLAREADVSLEELREGFARHYKSTRPQVQPLFPGVVEVCEYARSIGGTNVIITHRGRESALQLLATHEMGAYFVDILTRGDGYPRKPDPAIYEAMIERHGFRREETLAIGDRGIDVLAGQAAGVRACLFGSASDQVAADFTIADYAELRRILVAERNQVFPGTAFHTVPVSLWEGKCS